MVEPETSKRVGTCSASLEKGKKNSGEDGEEKKRVEKRGRRRKGKEGKAFSSFSYKSPKFCWQEVDLFKKPLITNLGNAHDYHCS